MNENCEDKKQILNKFSNITNYDCSNGPKENTKMKIVQKEKTAHTKTSFGELEKTQKTTPTTAQTRQPRPYAAANKATILKTLETYVGGCKMLCAQGKPPPSYNLPQITPRPRNLAQTVILISKTPFPMEKLSINSPR
jgi:hypothetical protein